jgi:NADPH-dependent ferric siderophore reductase
MTRVRREPPPFRRVSVRRVEFLTPFMARVSLSGPELAGFTVELPAASVRLLLPAAVGAPLVVPSWNGNEFLHADGARPIIRTFTPLHADPEKGQMDLDVVLHDGGAASAWVRTAEPGTPAAISGPGRGYVVDPDASSFLLIGDETAIPAISQLLETVSADVAVQVIVEIDHPGAKFDLPEHPGAAVRWFDRSSAAPPGSALLAAVHAASLPAGVSVWAAGEAAAMHAIRRHLFEGRGLARSQATIRGYWKYGRGTQTIDDA